MSHYGTLLVLKRSRRMVIEFESVLSLKKTGATQLLLFVGTEIDTVTSLVSEVITVGATSI
jgi:hypothetical protein